MIIKDPILFIGDLEMIAATRALRLHGRDECQEKEIIRQFLQWFFPMTPGHPEIVIPEGKTIRVTLALVDKSGWED